MKAWIRRVGTSALLAVSALWVLSPAAFAAVAPVTEVTSEVTGIFTEAQTIVVGIVGALFALMLVGIAVRIGMKYANRARQAA